MEDKDIYEIQRHIQYIANKINALEATLNEINNPLSKEILSKWEKWDSKF
jgi:prefoldin subunit 5